MPQAKSVLQKNAHVIYHNANKCFRKIFFLFIYEHLPRAVQIWAVKAQFYVKQKYWPNILHPKSFNEKIQHRKLFGHHNPLFTLCADKYLARGYIEKKVGAEYLIPLKAVVNRVDDLKFDEYGNDFILKATHNSGRFHIVRDGKYDHQAIVKDLSRTLNLDYGKLGVEPWYSKIKPRIIVEQLLLDKNGQIPLEYKFHVFKNKGATTVILHVDYDKHGNRQTSYYSEDGNLLDFKVVYPVRKGALDKPANFQTMLAAAKTLAEDFDYVRVDLYNLDGKIYCGELTFAQASGHAPFDPIEYDYTLGQYWQLPSK